jgi:hypothetical protein
MVVERIVEERAEQLRAQADAEPRPGAPDDAADGLRFEDPAWDDEYCTWLDNGLRTCCG